MHTRVPVDICWTCRIRHCWRLACQHAGWLVQALPDGRGSDFLARVVTGPVAWRRAGTIGRERAIMAATWGHKENSWKTYMRYCPVIAPAWKICRTRGPAPGCGDRKTRYAAV